MPNDLNPDALAKAVRAMLMQAFYRHLQRERGMPDWCPLPAPPQEASDAA